MHASALQLIISKKGSKCENNSTNKQLLSARDFYEVTVDEAEGRINYRFIEIESE